MDLYTEHLESKAKIEQLEQLFGGEFRVGRAEAAPQLRQDPAVAGRVGALYSAPEPSSGEIPEMRVLPHLMTTEEITNFIEVAKFDEGENRWAKEFEQFAIRPGDELADPGPRGRFDRTPAISEEGALVVINDNGDNERDDNGDNKCSSMDG